MNGKIIKVKTSNYEFGVHDRCVNILGCFKYIPNGNIYIIYTDVDTNYNILHYGSGHIRDKSALCMEPRDKQEEEIIKEYIFKLTNKDNLDNFSFISLDNIEEIEIINSFNLEIKKDILSTLIEIVIPKPEINNEIKEEKIEEPKLKVKKKSTKSSLIILLLIVIIGIVVFFIFKTPRNNIEKSITCTKEYKHNILNSNIKEVTKYNFNNNDKLLNIDITNYYQFTESNYNDFILKGTIYKYTPSKDKGTWTKDDNNYTFTTTTKEIIDTSYNLPTNYEEVLSYSKNNGYTCTEKIESD